MNSRSHYKIITSDIYDKIVPITFKIFQDYKPNKTSVMYMNNLNSRFTARTFY